MMHNRDIAAAYIRSHGHAVHLDDERIVAEVECVFPDGRVAIEYETFMPIRQGETGYHYDIRPIRDWLGY